MKTERTIRKQMRALYTVAHQWPEPVSSEAYAAAGALQWVLQNTDWTLLGELRRKHAAQQQAK